MEEKVYEINNPDDTSPILITTNYALDFFHRIGGPSRKVTSRRICASRIRAVSGVLAAWTSGKFTGEAIAEYIAKYDMTGKVKHRKMIIPGVAKKLKEELEEELPEWEIILGPNEAGDIPKFLSDEWRRNGYGERG